MAEVDRESCPVCGFVWADVPEAQIPERIVEAARSLAGRLTGGSPALAQRPEPTTWSPIEYGAHVRDVLLHVRDRLVITLVEDDATFKPLYRDERVDLGLYAGDDADEVAMELVVAAALFARTFGRIDRSALDRACQYGYPVPTRRTLRWMGQQVVHELEHHLDDVDRTLSGSPRS